MCEGAIGRSHLRPIPDCTQARAREEVTSGRSTELKCRRLILDFQQLTEQQKPEIKL
ncbi:MAG: hypothetical protein JGK26_28250 [Microcoleus sp. PH2017_27_LUM_O_A]|uniref:hypothetical protein n=1 Tax=unclassified Microcoleus TaxID=2642155 RepID=UPI001D9E9FAB|nr:MULTISPECIES: hypothetical protein [unclassified Microcoleus]MCC3463612.1 hypothetical protein [Microcoleus sp. PH2017_11_PCY_U_A]MCC3562933.1 hypothetical protein [Microcoleus sp. PH2017_27_LUM_O_A]